VRTQGRGEAGEKKEGEEVRSMGGGGERGATRRWRGCEERVRCGAERVERKRVEGEMRKRLVGQL
jgi:hypothetical protein